MTPKQTRCPNCQIVYKVSVTQLTLSQGMVCCAKCSTEFNALVQLVVAPEQDDTYESMHSSQHTTFSQPLDFDAYASEKDVFDIFERKIEGSNINLRTYLNNLNSFNHEPITNFPSLNLSSQHNVASSDGSRHSTLYYVIWSLANLALVFLLIFQIMWFNPNFLERHPVLNSAFISVCHALSCETIDERYSYITIHRISVKAVKDDSVVFKGQLINEYKKGMELPLIKVSLIKDGVVSQTTIKTPSEYLIKSLTGITRIPTKSPYGFEFTIQAAQNSFDQYKLEVIRP